MADVTLTITIPDAHVARVGAALGVSTKAQFEAWVRDEVKSRVISYEARQAEEAAKASVQTAVDAQQAAVDAAIADVETNLTLG